MLVLTRRKNESVVINNDITVTVVEIRGDKVRLGVVCPVHVPVHRQEVYEAIHGRPDPGRPLAGSVFPLPVTLDAAVLAWNGGLVLKLARGIRDEWAFDRLPVLADALEEAGCRDAELLAHFRGPGTHAARCHVLDLLLQGT